jgi:hypothetical protein
MLVQTLPAIGLPRPLRVFAKKSKKKNSKRVSASLHYPEGMPAP